MTLGKRSRRKADDKEERYDTPYLTEAGPLDWSVKKPGRSVQGEGFESGFAGEKLLENPSPIMPMSNRLYNSSWESIPTKLKS